MSNRTKNPSSMFLLERQKGIHHVKNTPERVIVSDAWSIEVPTGYSYSADRNCTGPDEDGDPYMLHIQTTKDCDLKKSYQSEIEVMVKSKAYTVNYYTLDATELSDGVHDLLIEFRNSSSDEVIFVKQSKDIVIAMSGSTTQYMFAVCVAGLNLLYHGIITFLPDSKADKREVTMQFLESIEPVRIEDVAGAEALSRLDGPYIGDFATSKYVKVDNNFKVPVPSTYKSSNNVHEGVDFVVAEKSFNFRNDPTTAKFSICFRKLGDVVYQKDKAFDVVMRATEMVNDMMPTPVFDTMLFTAKFDERGVIVYGTCTDSACTKNTNPVIVFADDKLYYGIVTINYGSAISDEIDTMWDQRVITTAWLSRILFKGERPVSKPKHQPGKVQNMGAFEVSEVPDKRKKLIDNQSGYPIRFVPHSELSLNWEHDMNQFEYLCSVHCPEIFDAMNSVIEHAEKYAALFKDNGLDTELRAGKLRNSAPIHALRSFIWTAAETQEDRVKKRFPTDVPDKMWIDLAGFIRKHGYANYSPVDKNTKRFGAAFLRKEEVRSIYSAAFEFSNDRSLYKDQSVGKTMSNASVSNFFQVVNSMDVIRPVMEIYYKYLSEENDLSTDVVEGMKAVLEGWTVFAFACRQPFYIVPGEYIGDDVNLSSAPGWTKAPELTELDDGKFVLIGTEIVEFKGCGAEVRIPEGVTGIIVSEETKPDLDSPFNNTNKLIYPRSFTGPILIPTNVEEIEVLGDLEKFQTRRLSDDIAKLKAMKIQGRPKSIGAGAFDGLNNLKKIVIPEGVETINNSAFHGWEGHGTIVLPESLASIGEHLFTEYAIDPNVTINVYKDCPVIGEIKKQLAQHEEHVRLYNETRMYYSPETHYQIVLKELDSPWATRADRFTNQLVALYANRKIDDVTEREIKELLASTIGDLDNYKKCKEYLISRGTGTHKAFLVELLGNSSDDAQLYEILPQKLADDINRVIRERIQEEKSKKFKEVETLSQSNKITDLNRAINILDVLKKEGEDVDPAIDRISNRIEEIKAERYANAGTLASELTVLSLETAIKELRSILPYKDATDKIQSYQELIEKETAYENAIDKSASEDPVVLKEARKQLDELGDYKDSKEEAEICTLKINSIIEEDNKRAEELIASGDNNSLSEVRRMYERLTTFDDDKSRVKTYREKMRTIDEIGRCNETLKNLKSKHSELGGLFKRKKRLAVEQEMERVENQISELRNTLIN